MTTKHTPGPWVRMHKLDGNRLVGDGAYGFITVDKITDNEINRCREMEANACLIAAAPELLEACKEFKLWYMTLGHLNHDSLIALKKIIPNELINTIERAIAKAEEANNG